MTSLQNRIANVEDPFQSFGNWRKISLDSRIKLKSIGRYQVMTRDNDCKYRVGLILSGVIGVKRVLSDGRWIYYSLMRAGEFFDLRKHSKKAENQICALGDAVVLGFDAKKFDDALSICPQINKIYQTELQDQMSAARDHFVDIALKTPMERLASAIFEFQEWAPSKNNIITLPINRRDLAHYLSITPETLSRVFHKIQAENLITIIKSNKLQLLDGEKLAQIADGNRPRKQAQ